MRTVGMPYNFLKYIFSHYIQPSPHKVMLLASAVLGSLYSLALP